MVKIILVTHGDMARSLLDTAGQIIAFDQSAVDVFTVTGKINFDELSLNIKDKIDQQGTLILVDTFGGSSCNVCATLTYDMPNVAVLCGVNLNMLIAALSNSGRLPVKELAAKVLEDGKKAVINVTEKLK